MKKLLLIFPTHTDRSAFVGWFLDGGGQQGYQEALAEQSETPALYAVPPDGRDVWDWQRLQLTADEHAIAMVPEDQDV